MSMTAIRYNAIEDAKRAYKKAQAAAYQQEYNTMNEVLEILKNADKPLTARQIAAECGDEISISEVACNLIAMNAGNSRFARGAGYGVHSLKVPERHSIKIKRTLNRHVKVVELDEDGNPTNRVHTLSLKRANTYQL